MRVWGAAIAAMILWAGAARAQDKHDLCSERPGLDTPPCVIEAGHVQLETGFADWTLDKQGGTRTDTTLFGDSLVRIGVGGGLEARIGWTPYGIVRERDEDGAIDRAHRVGDVTLGLKQSLRDADKTGSGPSLALIAFGSVPVGREPVGAGDWGAGMLLPIDYDLTKSIGFALTPEVDAAVDSDGRGRHLAYSLASGFTFKLGDAVSVAVEGQAMRDDDPDPQQRGTQLLGSLSLAVQPDDHTQLDLGSVAGLNRQAPDLELYAGVTRWF